MAFELFRAPFAGSDLYGRKPNIPQAPTSSGILSELINSINSILPSATETANKTTDANMANIMKMFQAIPGFDQMSKASVKEINSEQSGEIPQGVADYIQNSTAANALGRGVAGGGFQRNLFKTGLVKEGIRRTEAGLGAAQRWIAGMASFMQPGVFNVSQMFLTPSQQIDISNFKFQRDLMQEKVNAAPDPVRAGRLAYEAWVAATAASMYGGSGPTTTPTGQPISSSTTQSGTGEDAAKAAEAFPTDTGSSGGFGSDGGSSGGFGGIGGIGGMMGGVGGFGGIGCWVAREVFGNDNPQWLAFWAWKEFVGPRWFRDWYAQHGERFAFWIADKPKLKEQVKLWMLSKIS